MYIFFDSISICVFLDAHIAFVDVKDVYSLFSPCMSGSLRPPQQQSERGLMSVYLFSLSLYSLFLSREREREICGGWVGTGGKYKKKKPKENGFI